MTAKEAIYVIGNLPIPTDDECYTIYEYQVAKAKAIEALGKLQMIEHNVNYLKLCQEEAKSKDWADGIGFALSIFNQKLPVT